MRLTAPDQSSAVEPSSAAPAALKYRRATVRGCVAGTSERSSRWLPNGRLDGFERSDMDHRLDGVLAHSRCDEMGVANVADDQWQAADRGPMARHERIEDYDVVAAFVEVVGTCGNLLPCTPRDHDPHRISPTCVDADMSSQSETMSVHHHRRGPPKYPDSSKVLPRAQACPYDASPLHL